MRHLDPLSPRHKILTVTQLKRGEQWGLDPFSFLKNKIVRLFLH